MKKSYLVLALLILAVSVSVEVNIGTVQLNTSISAALNK